MLKRRFGEQVRRPLLAIPPAQEGCDSQSMVASQRTGSFPPRSEVAVRTPVAPPPTRALGHVCVLYGAHTGPSINEHDLIAVSAFMSVEGLVRGDTPRTPHPVTTRWNVTNVGRVNAGAKG